MNQDKFDKIPYDRQAEVVREEFIKLYKKIADKHSDLTENFQLHEKSFGTKPLYNLIYISDYGFFALNFDYINFDNNKIVLEINLYTQGYNGKEKDRGEQAQSVIEDLISKLVLQTGCEFVAIADWHSFSSKLLHNSGYVDLEDDGINQLKKLDVVWHNVPKNSLLRLTPRKPTESLSVANSIGLQSVISKYKQIPMMIKYYSQDSHRNELEGENKQLNEIVEDIKSIPSRFE